MKIITQGQYTKDWWDARRGVPTASNAKSILTPTGKPSSAKDGGQSAYIDQLIGERFDPAYPRENEYQSPAMKNGSQREKESIAWYAFAKGVEVHHVGLCMDEAGRFGFSPDCLVGEDRDRPEGIVEAKNPSYKIHTRWLRNGQLPDEHKPQVHFILVASGVEWVDFVSYATGMKELCVRVTPDDYTAKMREQMEVFWCEYQEALKQIRAMSPDTEFTNHQEEQELAKVF